MSPLLTALTALVVCLVTWGIALQRSPVAEPFMWDGDDVRLLREAATPSRGVALLGAPLLLLGLVLAALALVLADSDATTHVIAPASIVSCVLGAVVVRRFKRESALRLTRTHLETELVAIALSTIHRVEIRERQPGLRELVLHDVDGGPPVSTNLPFDVAAGDRFVEELRARITVAPPGQSYSTRDAGLPRARVVDMPYTRDRDPS